MAKKTNKEKQVTKGTLRESFEFTGNVPAFPDFKAKPFKSLKDVYHRIICETLDSWVLNLEKKLLNFHPHKNHFPLRGVDLSVVRFVHSKPIFTETAEKEIERLDSLLRQHIIRGAEDYSQVLTHFYYGLAYFSLGNQDTVATLEGQKLIEVCDKLLRTVKEEFELLVEIKNLPAYRLMRNQGKLIRGADLVETYFKNSTNYLNSINEFREVALKEMVPPTGKNGFRDLGIRLIFDTIKHFKVPQIRVPELVVNLPCRDDDLDKIIERYQEESSFSKRDFYFDYVEIITFQVIAYIYGAEALPSKEVAKIIRNRETKKRDRIPFQGAEDSIFFILDEESREKFYKDFILRIKDDDFTESTKDIPRATLGELSHLIEQKVNQSSLENQDELISQIVQDDECFNVIKKAGHLLWLREDVKNEQELLARLEAGISQVNSGEGGESESLLSNLKSYVEWNDFITLYRARV